MADDKDELVNQDDIERLLSQPGDQGTPAPKEPPAAAGPPEEDPLGQGEIEALLGGGGDKPAAKEESSPEPDAQPAPPTAEAAAPPAAETAVQTEEIEDADKLLGQNDIEALLNKAGKTPPPVKAAPPKQAPPPPPSAGGTSVAPGDVEFLLNQAEQALASIDSENDAPDGVVAFKLQQFAGAPASTENATIDLISDVELDLKIELGRTHMYLEDILKLRKGSVVPLDKLAGDPVDIYANGRLIARGEVLVLNDNFCVRVAELVEGSNIEV